MSRQHLTVEIWKDIKDYEGYYQASNFGRIRSLDRVVEVSILGRIYERILKGRILKTEVDKYGYHFLELSKNGIKKRKSVHRLVAETFIPNPNNLPQVNHKNEDKSNNCVWNLEWCTQPYNTNYGTRNERIAKKQINDHKKSKQVFQYTLNNELVNIWLSISECGRNGYGIGSVSRCCNGIQNTHKGYKWSYEPL